jgi:hypothetical protein
LLAGLSTSIGWGIRGNFVRAVYGNTFAGHGGLHIRFGPNATAFEKPRAGSPHS